MSIYTIKHVFDFVCEKMPENEGKKISLEEILRLLSVLYISREQYFAENGIHHDYWSDDDEYNNIYEYIDFIKFELRKKYD